MTSPDFWKLLNTLSRSSKSAARVFDILEKGTSGSPPAIMADNYEAAVSLLDNYASAADRRRPAKAEAGVGTSDQQQQKEK